MMFGGLEKTVADILAVIKAILKYASRCKYVVDLSAMNVAVKQKNTPVKTLETTDYKRLIEYLQNEPNLLNQRIFHYYQLKLKMKS